MTKLVQSYQNQHRRTISFVLSCLLILSLSPALAASTIKPGSSCTKVGESRLIDGTRFKCVKTAKRFQWKRIGTKSAANPVAVPSPKPSPLISPTPLVSPTPSPAPSPSATRAAFIPWSTEFDSDALVRAALQSTSEYFGEVKPDSSYELNIDPKITESDRAWITKALDYAHGSFRNIEQENMRVFLGTTHAWSRDTVRSQGIWIGDPGSSFPCSQGLNDAYCADRNKVLLIYSDIYGAFQKRGWDTGRQSTPAHEVFHVVQNALWPNVGPDDPRYIPTWLKEGSANYYGFYVVDKLGFDTYQSGRNQQVRFNPAYRTAIPLSEYQGYGAVKNGVQLDPYGIGQAATEYLIASAGFKAVLDIFRFTSSEKSFVTGFKKATGIELVDFYQKFESARKSMNIGS